jgi:hypothetical protein
LDRRIAGAEGESDSSVFFSVLGFGSVEIVGVTSAPDCVAAAFFARLFCTGRPGEGFTESADSADRACSGIVKRFGPAGRLVE